MLSSSMGFPEIKGNLGHQVDGLWGERVPAAWPLADVAARHPGVRGARDLARGCRLRPRVRLVVVRCRRVHGDLRIAPGVAGVAASAWNMRLNSQALPDVGMFAEILVSLSFK